MPARAKAANLHAYVFVYHDYRPGQTAGDDVPFYECTVGADKFGLRRAQQIIKERGPFGFVSIDCLPPRYFY